MTTDKVLDKLKKIQAHAESAAAIGNEAEAQAFASMLQRLLLTHKLEMTDLEFEVMEKIEPIIRKGIDYQDVAEKKSRVAWRENLASMLARAQFCRILVTPGSSRITLVGKAEDVAVVEYMIVTLTRATESIVKKEHQKYCWEVYKRDNNCTAARGFKESFLTGFLVRLNTRLKTERAAMVNTSTALVRVNTALSVVEKHIEDDKKIKKSAALARMEAHNGEGLRRGKAVADGIDLGGKAMGGSDVRRLQ